MTKHEVEVITLENGMRVVVVPMEGVKSLTVLAMAGVGSRFEDPSKAGISHFLEHLPFKGTKNYPTAMEVATAIDGVGGKHNAFTSKEYTGYWVKVASSKWRLALDVVSDLLLTARLRSEDIEREKGVIVEEINMYEDEPQAKVSNLFDELVFKGSSLARDVIGEKKTVMGLTREDFREHWDKWYGPQNVVVGMVGDTSKLKTQNLKFKTEVETYFSKGRERVGGGERVYGVPEQLEPRLTVFFKETEQAHFHMGFPGISRGSEQRYVMSVLVTLLGGNSSSRLFNEIREKRGLAYYAYASADLHHDAGSVYAFEGVSLDKIEEAIKVTRSEFEKVSDDVTEEEVERAKEFVIGKMALDLEDSANMANLMVRRLLLEGKVESIEEMVARVRAVERDEVAGLAEWVFDFKKLNLAIVGPYKDKGRFEELLEGRDRK